uniref:Ovule protein n=1 Tax=Elaeophora elaphi TaxID=1147741 RepID=A0A0R3S0D6_9BILA
LQQKVRFWVFKAFGKHLVFRTFRPTLLYSLTQNVLLIPSRHVIFGQKNGKNGLRFVLSYPLYATLFHHFVTNTN